MAAKKKTAKAAAKKKVAEPVDLRAPIAPTPANLTKVLADFEKAIAHLTPPEEPQPGDLINALLHIVFSRDLACGYGQEAHRRIEIEYVDRNEYRVTEAYEVEEIFTDFGLDDMFERCRDAKESVSQIHNDHNHVALEFLREASITERKGFFVRVPGIPPYAVKYINQILAFDEILFSPRSTARVQQRLGFPTSGNATEKFFARIRELIAPFGHVPLQVSTDKKAAGKPVLTPELCPLCTLVRVGAK